MLISLIGEMAAKIRYRSVPLTELMTELSESSAYSGCAFLAGVNSGMKQGETVPDAWVKSARKAPFISDTDRDILADLGARLGDSDTEGQLSMLALASEMLGRSLELAEQDCTKRAQSLFTVWALCGIGAGIVIL